MSSITIRPANINDSDTIFSFINELAVYEKAPDEVVTTASEIRETLFGEAPQAHALISEVDGQTAGYAVYFFSYSTWLGKQGIYLEDLYISPKYRGKGAGKALLKALAKTAVEQNCGRVEWSVLDWNQPAIDFYRSFGAKPKDEWIVYRLTGDALKQFAKD